MNNKKLKEKLSCKVQFKKKYFLLIKKKKPAHYYAGEYKATMRKQALA